MKSQVEPEAAEVVGWSEAGVGIEERPAWRVGGAVAVVVGVVLVLGGAAALVWGGILLEGAAAAADEALGGFALVSGVLLILLAALVWSSLVVVSPGEGKVVQFFGRYIGTLREPGLAMTVPLSSRVRTSVKVHNFETNELKVNDADGNPVNIAAIVVWQVADTAKAVFAVERHEEFVAVQSEAALRHVASSRPYDTDDSGRESLRGSTELVADELAREVAARVAIAGIEVVEARISSLAYAQEIAQAMLQRQQASAVIAAREKIVEGAVSMVNGALERLEREHIVDLDEERKAAMVSNLLVVLASDSRVSPVVNAGSLYT